MPFEPLQTDEKLEAPVKPGRDFEGQLLVGCGTFVVASVVTYLLSAWPFFVIGDMYLLKPFLIACALGWIPASIFGLTVMRKTGLAGGCGFLAGAMTQGVFLFLRMEQLLLGHSVSDLPRPELPLSWGWIAPTVWAVSALLLVVLFVPKREFADEPRGEDRR